MGKSDPRRLQSVGQLREHLRNEREKLDIACVAYDNGQRAAAELIAVNARLLLHHTKQSKALLEQLGLRSRIRYVDTYRSPEPCHDVGSRLHAMDSG